VSAAQQYAELRERKLDLILGRVNLPGNEDAEVEILHQELTHVVAGAGNPWSRRRRRFAFADLADEPWALPPVGTLVGALFAEAFRAHGVDYPPKRVVLGNIHVHCALVADGGFLALLPVSVVRVNADRFGLRILQVQSPVPASPVGLLYLKRREIPPVMRNFIECARESAKVFSHNVPPYNG
jgi:DNA-binding transcriptional LysR family regulator